MSSTSGVISGSIKWTGLASGTDFGAVVEKLVAIERRTITRQETWRTEWQEKIVSINTLNTRLVTLKLDAQDKDLRSELLSRKTTVGNESILTVNNTSTADLGSYEVNVGTNIQEKLASRSFGENDNVGPVSPVGVVGKDDLKITVGSGASARTLILERKGLTTPPTTDEYDPDDDIAALAAAINAAATNQGVGLTASILNDKTRGTVDTKRLVLTATNGGTANHITIDNDPTDLKLGKNFIDAPVYTTFLGSDIEVGIATNADYIGPVNKSFTFMFENTGVIGVDDISVQWADTEGHSGKILVTAAEYNDATPSGSQEYEVFQGLSVKFDANSNSGRVIKNEAFTIDCQAPILQKGQDSGLAQTDKLVHQGFVDKISPIHTGSTAKFIYSYQGIEYTVNVTDQMSLANLSDAINNDEKNPGITASIVNDGLGTSTSYHLVLTGRHTGAESVIKVIEPSDPLEQIKNLSMAEGTFTRAREASNAMVKIDGFPADNDSWLQRKNNEVADVIDGVVLTLTGVGQTTLTVSNDATAMRDKIIQLVNSVNYCKSYILEQTKWGESNLVVDMNEAGEITTNRANKNGIMIGNYGFQIAQSQLDRLMNTSIVPFSTVPGLTTKERLDQREQYLADHGLIYSTLSEIGIKSDPNNKGMYTVEQNTLLQCINENPEAVIKLFTFSDEYPSIGPDGKETMVYIKGVAVDMGEKMTAMTSDTDVYDTQGNVIQKGKGILVTLRENYEGIIENITAKISREERRVESVKQRLTDKFNRLEVSLQRLQDQQSQLESSISSLGSNSG